MRRVVFLPLFFFSLMAGQEATVQKDFKITEAHYRLGNYEIVIKQQRRLKELSNQKEFDTHVGPVWCSAFLEIRENGEKIDRVEFNDIWPLGGNFGIHLPVKQESSRHFILMKYGNYDCRTIVITDEGNLFNLGGGSYRIFQNRYLISPRELADDPGTFSIFDLLGNIVLLTVSWRDLAKDISPSPIGNRAYIVKFYTNGPELFAGIVLVDIHSWQVIEHTGYFYRLDLERGKIAEAVFDENKLTEFVIDYSNLDLSNDCECKKRADKLS
jgi:hypothetical protein